MMRRAIVIAAVTASGLGVAAATLLAFYVFDQRNDGYPRGVTAILLILAASEMAVSVFFLTRRSLRSAMLFTVGSAPLAIYEYETAVAGVAITYFAATAAMATGCLALALYLSSRRV
jgi:hypothetical protein